MKSVKIINTSNPKVHVTAQVCDKFITKFLGLMFRKEINPFFGLLFKETSESRVNTSIHMFFMRFDISVLWLNSDYVVIDKTLAKKWRPFYASKHPAQFTLELHPDRLTDFSIGDVLEVVDVK